MKWLSRGVEELIGGELRNAKGKPIFHDAVVVGSGYGGAVSALRLAEKGVKVLVLERGEEWVSGEFPNDLGNAFGAVRMDRQSAANITGSESGLYDFRAGDGIGALVGNGLGGTSLINAGVVMMPDVRVFDKSVATGVDGDRRLAWPSTLRPVNGEFPTELADAFTTARDVLGAELFSAVDVETGIDADGNVLTTQVKPEKHLRLQELGLKISRDESSECAVGFAPVSLTVDLGGPQDNESNFSLLNRCVGCGDCVSGCNQNAKKSLNTTYLYQAYRTGARMFTGVSVLTVKLAADGHWIIRFVRTQTRAKQRDGIAVKTHSLHARHVILSAGTFGSSEILLRSKGQKLEVSKQLGERLSTNGDSLAFSYMLDKPVNGIGMGSKKPSGTHVGVGPTITGAIRIDHSGDVEQSVLIEEGAIPGAIAGLFHEMISASATFAQLDNWKFRGNTGVRSNPDCATDWSVLQAAGLTRTQTLLAMGHDRSLGSILFDCKKDRVAPCYAQKSPEPVYRLQEKHLSKIAEQGAIFIQNPVLSPLPDQLRRVLDAPVPGNAVFTVHPLGGCCMSDSVETGVVDDCGRVFNASASANELEWHRGLYVLDGSIVPTSLGVNPLLTITALAERAMLTLAKQIAEEVGAKPSDERVPAPDDAQQFVPGLAPYYPYTQEVKVNFTEAMRGELKFADSTYKAHLLLHMPIDDMALFWADRSHQIVIPSQRDIAPGDREELPARLRLDEEDKKEKGKIVSTRNLVITSGVVSILPVVHTRLDRAVSQVARTGLTWLLDRGFDEIARGFTDYFTEHPKSKSEAGLVEKVVGFFKLAKHASESRCMEYRLNLIDEYSQGAEPYKTYTLIGTKQVGYPAQWWALLRKALAIDAYLDRPNVWTAFGELTVRVIEENGNEVGHGVLNLDLLDMTRMHAPQLGLQRDTPNNLLMLAGYPLWFVRLLVKTRMWDFRLPDYPAKIPVEFNADRPEVPIEDVLTPWPELPPLRVFPTADSAKTINVSALELPSFEVPRSRTSNETVELRLTRYRQKSLLTEQGVAGQPVRIKAMLMLNGFAQSTLGFVPQEHKRRPEGHGIDEPGLAEFFYEQGFDIWLFDYRTSSILDASKLPCSMDDIAEFDIPGAVNRMLAILRAELVEQERIEEDQPAQIYAFAHCVGAASMAMSLLGGYLQNDSDKNIGKLAGVTFSQMQAFLIGSKTAQLRLQVGGFLRDTLGIEYLRLSAAERQATPFESLLDRMFASLPVDPNEHCPHENERYIPRPGICTCKRMSGTISRLLKHSRIKEETHDRLPIYFGRANTSLLVHGGRCVENERLVNADGQNVYVTDENILKYLRLPIAILHGDENALFNVESAYRTFDQLCRVNLDLEAAEVYQRIIAKGYAHFDCTIGFGPDMHKQILKPLRDFYRKAWEFDPDTVKVTSTESEASEPRTEGKAPLAGPVIGWTRTENIDGQDRQVFRVWIEVDETEADPASHAITMVRDLSTGHFVAATLWPIIRIPLVEVPGAHGLDLRYPPLGSDMPYVAIAIADLGFEFAEDPHHFHVTMFSVHPFKFNPLGDRVEGGDQSTNAAAIGASRASVGSTPSVPNRAGSIAPPMTVKELVDAQKPNRRPGVGVRPRNRFRLSGLGVLPRNFLRTPRRELQFGGTAALPSPPNILERDRRGIESNVDFTNTTLPKLFPSRSGVRPSVDVVTNEAAQLLLETLTFQAAVQRDTALRGDPRTLSRKSRQVPSNQGYAYTARIDSALLDSARAWKGLRFVAACCRYPGLAFEDRRADASFERIHELLNSDPGCFRDFMFMLGDQIYADASAGIIDSPSPIEKIALRNRKAFSTSGFNLITSQLPTYMVIDDHELGDNWSRDDLRSRNPVTKRRAKALFDAGHGSFTAYQWSHSPRNVNAPGFNYSFAEKDIPFFVLDTRTNRSRFRGAPRVCAQEQLDALGSWLHGLNPNDARPKFVVSGSVLAPGLRKWQTAEGIADPMAESWQMATQQRAAVLGMIAAMGVKNVVFLSGDYHCSATARLTFGAELYAYAIVTPPLYAPLPGANTLADEVLKSESIAIGRGASRKSISVTAKARDGQGFADIHVDRLAGEQWRLSVHFYLQQLDDKVPRYQAHSEHFLLS